MDIEEAILHRRTVRQFKDANVAGDSIEQVLKAGIWAPSPSNVQSWRFVVVDHEPLLTTVKNVSPGFPQSAPVAIIIGSFDGQTECFGVGQRDWLRIAEAAVAAQNMALMAYAIGLGSTIVASFSLEGVRVVVQLPKDVTPIMLVALGYPLVSPTAPPRAELSVITSSNSCFGGAK